MNRSKMSDAERMWRSQLTQMVHGREFVRGTLTLRERVCGKPNCICARGRKHVSLYLVQSKNGRTKQLHVHREWEERVKMWVKQYQNTRDLLEKISTIYLKKIHRRKE